MYPLIENEYKNGESQRSVLATNSRRRWRLAKRLTPSALQTLRDFFDARNGSTEPFYFYDPYDTNPRFSYDPTGVVTVGRYTVRFEGDWNQLTALGRSEINITLVEVA
ncbi:MAG: DUF2460 domain-containing protein [Acidobacteriia bacterium]|nr:DUF2460 domain-containing protein [Terriglobia bacterium]